MKFEQNSGIYNPVQMALPLFQPLRLWTPREKKVATHTAILDKAVSSLPKGFSMKGGFVSMPNGERRLMIIGKICKTVSIT